MSNKKNLLIYAHYYIPDTASTGQILRELAEGMLDKFNITQPTLSHHMKILVDCGIVNDRKEGKWHYYSLNKKVIREASSFIEALGR